jgi:two-component system OmpR family response regulator
MTKPVSMREFLARIRAMLRRAEMMKMVESSAKETTPSIIKVGGLEIDFARHKVSQSGTTIDLSPKEFDLLAFLLKNREQVFSRDQLLEKVWGYDYAGDTRTVDVHIRWLRQKIEVDPANPKHLLTVRGIGYKFEG